ncbi:MAG: TylF/MycF/NovP-related O-methyltransferase [Parvibaculum sp.]
MTGFEIRRPQKEPPVSFPVEFTEKEKELFEYVRDNELSMTSNERLFATAMACKYALERNISGDFVECGVWRGGNSILAAGIFRAADASRKTYLYDTFEGMTEPTAVDRSVSDSSLAMDRFTLHQRESHNDWCYASLDDVRNSFVKADLLNDNVRFIEGDVLKTLEREENLPEHISVLRLDTDWYESTKKELEVLYPRLSVGGVLIIDDYGSWAGSKKAVDEYFEINGNRPFLQYTDRSARIGVKS